MSGGDGGAGEDETRARVLVTQHVAFYVGGMGTFYRDALDRQGYPASSAHDAWQAGERERALDVVDGFVDDLAVSGTPAAARSALERFRSVDGLDEVALAFPRGATAADIATTLDALAPRSERA